MNLSAIAVRADEGQTESLAAALRAIATANTADVDYDHLLAALGLSLMTAAVAGEPLGRWPAFGRDAFLKQAAPLFGFTFRELHPPDAAVGLTDSAEFAIHFRDSYVPLIRRALESNQPVLAWMGWSPPATDQWGVITGYDASARRCTGTVLAAQLTSSAGADDAAPNESADMTFLTGPSYQLYVLEGYEPIEPGLDALRTAFMQHAAGVLANALASAMGVLTGPAAYEPWCEQLTDTNAFPKGEWKEEDARQQADAHRHQARTIINARQSALRFLAELDDPALGNLADLISQQCQRLVSSCNPAAMSRTFAEKKAKAALVEKIRQVGEIEGRIAQALPA